ncbi:MAG TPA: GNAT family N-acetyltransferase [Gammaproteobacteria bacterium]|nr:GNAT family N-acetyltransferase [Gammaproteobacteria bacterium]
MTELIGEVVLLDRENGNYEQAFVYEGICEQHIDDVERLWVPQIKANLSRIQNNDDIAALHIQDFHWNWRAKVTAFSRQLAYRSFALECGGQTQGLMYVNTTKRCRLEGQANQHLVYVEYLATAPWNRPSLVGCPKYKGVGSIMIATAIQASVDEEMQGRIGLHSLPQADPFYRDICGMTDLGVDSDKQNLRYFEMTAEQAMAFLNQ